MDFKTCVKERRSIRKFKSTAIEHEKILEIVKQASYSPSWKNTQIVRYLVVEDKEIIQRIADNCVHGFSFNINTINNASALVVMTMIPNRSGYERDGSYTTSKEDRWEMFDAGAAAQTFSLAAFDEGLGTVIMGIFDEQKLCDTLKLEKGLKIGAMIAIGYPDEEPQMPKRKEISELVSFM